MAALLSIIPGLGHWYKGKPVSGFGWFMTVLLGYCFLIVPGLLFHIVCFIDAAFMEEKSMTITITATELDKLLKAHNR